MTTSSQPLPAATGPLPRFRGWTFRPRVSIQVASLVGGLAAWETIAQLELVEPLFLPKLSDILQDLWKLISSGQLNEHLWVSGQEFGAGILLAIAVGVALGLAMGTSQRVDRALIWWVSGFDAIPRIAFTPLLIVWFGIGLASKIVLVFLSALFPITLATAAGVRTTSRELLEMADSFGIPPDMRFRSVILPAAVPFIVTGIRLGIARGLVGIVVGELFAARAGIGYLLATAGASFSMVRVFAMVIVLAVAGITLTTLARALERRFDSWRA